MELSHGKKENGDGLLSKLEIAKARRKFAAFGAESIEELNKNMQIMSLHSLQTLCVEVGCTPTGTKPFLQKRIRNEFKKSQRGASSIDSSVTSPQGAE